MEAGYVPVPSLPGEEGNTVPGRQSLGGRVRLLLGPARSGKTTRILDLFIESAISSVGAGLRVPESGFARPSAISKDQTPETRDQRPETRDQREQLRIENAEFRMNDGRADNSLEFRDPPFSILHSPFSILPLVLLPSAASREAFLNRLAERLPDDLGLCGSRIYTFPRLIDDILASAHEPVQYLSPPAVAFLLLRVMRGTTDGEANGQWTQVTQFPGFLAEVRRLIAELKMARVRPEDFAARVAGRLPSGALPRAGGGPAANSMSVGELSAIVEGMSWPSPLLAEVYSRYQDLLHSLSAYDHEGRFWWALRVLEVEGRLPEHRNSELGIRNSGWTENRDSRFGHPPRIPNSESRIPVPSPFSILHAPGEFWRLGRLLVDGFTDFTPVEEDVLAQLARRAQETVITLDWEEPDHTRHGASLRPQTTDPSHPASGIRHPASDIPYFDHTAGTRSRLRRLFPKAVEELLEGDGSQPLPVPGRITRLEVPGRDEEAAAIAAHAKMLILSGEAAPAEIGVLVPSVAEYADPLAYEFRKAGVPLRIEGEFPLIETPLVRWLLQLLSLPEQDWPRQATVAVLKCAYAASMGSGEAAEAPGPGFDPEMIDRASAQAGIVRGRKAWEELREQSEFGIGNSEFGATSPMDVGIGNSESRTPDPNRPQPTVGWWMDAFFGLMDSWPQVGTFSEHGAFLRTLMRQLGVLQKIARHPSSGIGHPASVAYRDLKALHGLLQLLEEVEGIDAELGEGGAAPMSRGEFLSALRSILADAAIPFSSHTANGVWLSDFKDGRQLHFKVAFVAGLAEGQFPFGQQEAVFYSDAQRGELATRGVGLPVRLRGLEEARSLFYSAVTRPRDGLYLCRATVDPDGTDRLESRLLQEFVEALGVEKAERVSLSQVTLPVNQCVNPFRLRDRLMERLWQASTSPGRPPEGADEDVAALEAAAAALTATAVQGVAEAAQAAMIERDRRLGRRPAHSGTLAHPKTRADLESRFGPGQPIRVTALETYAGCPFDFLCRDVFGLLQWEEPELGMTPLQRGQLYHDILSRVVETWIGEGARPVLPDNLHEIHEILDGVLQEVFRDGEGRTRWGGEGKPPGQVGAPAPGRATGVRAGARHSPAGLPAWSSVMGYWSLLLKEIARLDLRAYFHAEAERNAKEAEQGRLWVPWQTEGSFQLQIVAPTGSQGLAAVLTGRIDRVDLLAGGAGFRVIDYKTGSISDITPKRMKEGQLLQLPLYALAVQRSAISPSTSLRAPSQSRGDPKPASAEAADHAPGPTPSDGDPGPIGSPSGRIIGWIARAARPPKMTAFDLTDMLDQFEGRALSYVERIRSGDFALEAEHECPHFCPARAACRLGSLPDPSRSRTED